MSLTGIAKGSTRVLARRNCYPLFGMFVEYSQSPCWHRIVWGITIQSLLNFDIKAPNGLEVNSGSKVFERRAGGPAPALGRSDKRGETAWINDWPPPKDFAVP